MIKKHTYNVCITVKEYSPLVNNKLITKPEV